MRAAAVNFPEVLFMANQYQLTVPVPFNAASALRHVADGKAIGKVVLSVG